MQDDLTSGSATQETTARIQSARLSLFHTSMKKNQKTSNKQLNALEQIKERPTTAKVFFNP